MDLQVVYLASKSYYYPVNLACTSEFQSTRRKYSSIPGNERKKINWETTKISDYRKGMLMFGEIKTDFAKKNVDQINDNLVPAIVESANKVGLIRTSNGRTVQINVEPWLDEECREAKNLLNRALHARNKSLKTDTPYKYSTKVLRANFRNSPGIVVEISGDNVYPENLL